eukprot:1177147-Prorocentrum_minimum.AAC.3
MTLLPGGRAVVQFSVPGRHPQIWTVDSRSGSYTPSISFSILQFVLFCPPPKFPGPGPHLVTCPPAAFALTHDGMHTHVCMCVPWSISFAFASG